MSLVKYEKSNEVPYTVEDTYNALMECIKKIEGFVLYSYDDLTKTIHIKSNVSLYSSGENISVKVNQTEDGMSEITFLSTPRGGAVFSGGIYLNEKNINKIIFHLLKELKNYNKIIMN